jgi:hypothetical protein
VALPLPLDDDLLAPFPAPARRLLQF